MNNDSGIPVCHVTMKKLDRSEPLGDMNLAELYQRASDLLAELSEVYSIISERVDG